MFLRRKWRKLVLLLALGVVIGSGQVFLLRRFYGIPSVQSFILVALLLAICDFLYAWNVERTTRSEGPGVWNSIVGRQGKVVSAVGRPPGQTGTVRVNGEIWKARCQQMGTALPGERVRVTAREGLVLRVEPIGSRSTNQDEP
ncbi:MAG: hypothetical protein EHM61_09755 [Acidobacteria bacterium]|nr:MAG: hypothetical protein EHM61_09755 [Acidobacteriota bacterium]